MSFPEKHLPHSQWLSSECASKRFNYFFSPSISFTLWSAPSFPCTSCLSAVIIVIMKRPCLWWDFIRSRHAQPAASATSYCLVKELYKGCCTPYFYYSPGFTGDFSCCGTTYEWITNQNVFYALYSVNILHINMSGNAHLTVFLILLRRGEVRQPEDKGPYQTTQLLFSCSKICFSHVSV